MRDPAFAFRVTSSLSPQEAWERIVDVKLHGRLVPFTRGHGPSPATVRVGDRLVARTAIGPLGFDDVMEVAEATPARHLRLVKRGRVIGGSIEVSLRPSPRPDGTSGTVVEWHQELALPWLPQRLSDLAVRLGAPAVGGGYRFFVTRLLEAAPGGTRD